jgi:hypothetical protein
MTCLARNTCFHWNPKRISHNFQIPTPKHFVQGKPNIWMFSIWRKKIFVKILMIGVSISESELSLRKRYHGLLILKEVGQKIFVKWLSRMIFVQALEISKPAWWQIKTRNALILKKPLHQCPPHRKYWSINQKNLTKCNKQRTSTIWTKKIQFD